MQRRKFLQSTSLLTLWPFASHFAPWSKPSTTSVNRLEKWKPTSDDSIIIEWRFLAGRITDGDQDFGFIISISSLEVLSLTRYALTTHRQDFTGSQEFLGHTHSGTLDYDSSSHTYTFKDDTDQILATWQWDDIAQSYTLNTFTPQLNITNVQMIPQGPLISEGGDGNIKSGRLGSIITESDYYADWVTIEIGDVEKGVARVDMQGLRQVGTDPDGENNPLSEYDHRWFAIAVELQDNTSAWISAWKIEDPDGPYWTVTIARGSGSSWHVFSLTEDNLTSIVAPLEITALAFQPLPEEANSSQRTGKSWRLTAGQSQPNDLLEVEISVPPGQFLSGDAIALSTWVEEATGTDVQGTILTVPIRTAKLLAAESSFEYDPVFLPALTR